MQPRRVMAVDDSKLMLKMYEVMLRTFPLVTAGDGLEALKRLEEYSDIDLVLLDVNMPNMNGLEFLAATKASGALEKLKVIVITTDGKEDEIERGMAAGATAYMTKPFDSEQLLGLISKIGKAEAP